MAERIQTAAVLGAGVMGSGIAAHLAGAGIRTFLFDIVPRDLTDAQKSDPRARNKLAIAGLEGALKAKPAAFFDPDAARLVTPGNFDDDLGKLAECDLVIEAVVERLDIKKSLFAKVAEVLGPNAVLASNTSGLSIAAMAESLPASLQPRFLGMHFFNPVRYMRLLEIIPGPKTDPAITARIAAFGEWLGKGIVYGKDTPNFVANRIGTYSMMKCIHVMQADGYTIEEVDKIVGTPMGRPKSAAFQTADIVGIDTFAHVAKNCFDALPNDPERDVFKMPEWIEKLVQSGRLGRKTSGGFYKKTPAGMMVVDYTTLEYRPEAKVRIDSLGVAKNVEDVGQRMKGLIAADDRAGKFAWKVLSHSLAYAARMVGEIADDVVNVDRAMRWGFNWDMGPFEAWDAIGVEESVARMKADGVHVPAWVTDMLASGKKSFYAGTEATKQHYVPAKKALVAVPRDPRHVHLAALKEDKKRVVKGNFGATLVDIGDGVLCLEVHTKMNTVDADVIEMMREGVAEAEKNFEALVIGNDGQHFGAGANLMLIYMGAQQQEWDQIDKSIRDFQNAVQGLRYAKVPVVAAPFQYTFGGAAEIAMGADACQAHAETYMGLVEVGVGLVPGGGGCLRMVERWTEDAGKVEGSELLPFVGQASLNIAMAKVATGGEEAKRLRYLLPTDGISLNRDHLLYEAKQRALGMARAGYRPPRPRILKAAGLDAAKTIGIRVWGMVEGGFASAHDALIAKKVAHICCGGNVAAGAERTEQDYLDLEREAFLSLCGEEKSQARMASILMSNKPLRN
ncbi:3-hydroxyacyl-CoA dehydrogenase NAD-binding domain-containing protein [Myxococcota bacterium]|nr:3-hydroxyacyl-CoA dehydrogenase NAD-binding domain-containing protein [Myxococcota bacterium]